MRIMRCLTAIAIAAFVVATPVRADDVQPDDPLADACHDGPPEGRLDACRRLVARTPDDRDARIALGDAQKAVGDTDAATATWTNVAEAPATTTRDFVLRAAALERVWKREAARKAIDRALELAPDDVDALALRADMRMADGDADGARADLDRGLAIDPKSPGLLLQRARLAGAEGPRAAIPYFERLAAVSPEGVTILRPIAEAMEKMGDRETALRLWDQILEKSPDDAAALARRGALRIGARRLAEARADFDRALAVDPRSVRALSGRGVVNVIADRDDEALRDFEAALAIDPRYAAAACNLGALQFMRGDRKEAMRLAEIALASDPDLVSALHLRARLHAANGAQDLAAVDLERAERLDRIERLRRESAEQTPTLGR